MRELQERDALLGRIRTYVDQHGLTQLTMDGLARALAMPRARLEAFFENKEEIAVALIARDRVRQRAAFLRIDSASTLSRIERGRNLWKFFLETESDSKLLFESMALGLRDQHYRDFVHGVDDWIAITEEALARDGFPREKATAFATLALAVYRGAMMDVCATGERARVSAAMELWFEATSGEEEGRGA